MNVLKKILKILLVFLIVDILYFAFLKFGFFVEGWDESELMMIEFYIICGLVYAYLGVRYLHCVRKIELPLTLDILFGIGFFLLGVLTTLYFPIRQIGLVFDIIGTEIFNITEETLTQQITVLGFCSVGTALICYETAERKYRRSQEENKTENIE